MGIYGYAPLEIPRTNQVYAYPFWANLLGWIIAASSSLCIPIVAIYFLLSTKGSFLERLKICTTPFKDSKKSKQTLRPNKTEQMELMIN
jgi:solute carrier family 6 dopamine transporter-like protein 3